MKIGKPSIRIERRYVEDTWPGQRSVGTCRRGFRLNHRARFCSQEFGGRFPIFGSPRGWTPAFSGACSKRAAPRPHGTSSIFTYGHIIGFGVHSLHRALAFLVMFLFISTVACSDETHSRYFDQLRQRGLFSLAEGEAISRLTADKPTLADRTTFSIEHSKTLTEHAGFVSDEERDELWLRANIVVQELLDHDTANPRSILLEGQLAAVSVSQGDWLRAERELRPFDEALLNRARSVCSDAIERLQKIEKRLTDPRSDSETKKSKSTGPSGFELRALLHQVRWQIGLTFSNRAQLVLGGSADRTTNITNAEQSLRRLTGVADEPLQTRSKLALVTCARLKGDLDRAAEMLNGLDKTEPKPIDPVLDEISAERVRVLMEMNRPDEAAELLLKVRNKRQRLTGELWFLQVRALIAMRDIALGKQQDALAEQFSEQIATTIRRCDDQVGGFWARRCRQRWDNAQTSRKYGPELDALMQQARMDYTGGRIEVALAEYADAEKLARTKAQMDLAAELGFTRASILLDQKQNEPAATEFFRLASEYATSPRAANSHLLGSYALGRLYDEKKSQQRREAYTNALEQHLKEYQEGPTINEARFLRGQLEEQRLQATQALRYYLDIEPGHARAPDAIAGAARCYEVILRRMNERNLPTAQFEQEATEHLTKFLSAKEDSVETWTNTHADVALRLISILLMNTSPSDAPDEREASQETGRITKLQVPVQSARFELAARWLGRVTEFIDRHQDEPESASALRSLRERTEPFRVIISASNGNIAEAERHLKSLSGSPIVLLSVVDSLNRLASSKPPSETHSITLLLNKAAELLLAQKDKLSPAQISQLDQALIQTYLSSGQTAKAIGVFKRQAESTTKDVQKQRELARQLAEMKDADAVSLAKQSWRRVESLTKPGSADWMTARLAVLRSCVRLNQFDEGRKLLQVTKVLYPDLGGPEFAIPFQEIAKELESR